MYYYLLSYTRSHSLALALPANSARFFQDFISSWRRYCIFANTFQSSGGFSPPCYYSKAAAAVCARVAEGEINSIIFIPSFPLTSTTTTELVSESCCLEIIDFAEKGCLAFLLSFLFSCLSPCQGRQHRKILTGT